MHHATDHSLNDRIFASRERFHNGLPFEDNHPIRPAILASWERCKALGVPPHATASRLIPPDEFQLICQKNKALLDIAIPAINTFYENIRGSDTPLAPYGALTVVVKLKAPPP